MEVQLACRLFFVDLEGLNLKILSMSPGAKMELLSFDALDPSISFAGVGSAPFYELNKLNPSAPPHHNLRPRLKVGAFAGVMPLHYL